MDIWYWVPIIASLFFALFSDEIKQIKYFLVNRSGSLKARYLEAKKELVDRYSRSEVYRSYSNVVAIKSMTLGFVYLFMLCFIFLVDVNLITFENQTNNFNLSLSRVERNIAIFGLASISALYLLSAGYRMRCHKRAAFSSLEKD